MPDHPPTQPAPMSEDELKEYERLAFLDCEAGIIPMSQREAVDELAAEVRRLQAAVTEESKRADRAEAAARELRQLIRDMGITYVGHTRRAQLMASTAWLTGGNEQPITEEGKGNGK